MLTRLPAVAVPLAALVGCAVTDPNTVGIETRQEIGGQSYVVAYIDGLFSPLVAGDGAGAEISAFPIVPADNLLVTPEDPAAPITAEGADVARAAAEAHCRAFGHRLGAGPAEVDDTGWLLPRCTG